MSCLRLASLLLAVALPASTAIARPDKPRTTGPRDCQPMHGTFTNTFLLGPVACPDSPVEQCTEGELAGSVEGSYAFNFLTSRVLGNGVTTPVQAFTGESVVTLDGGTVFGADFGRLRLVHFPLADFTTHLTIEGGTGEFEGASGHLTIQGLASFVTGEGSGTYHGQLCVPR